MLVELGPLMRDTTLTFHPAVFLANAVAAFILNLVRNHAHPEANVALHYHDNCTSNVIMQPDASVHTRGDVHHPPTHPPTR